MESLFTIHAKLKSNSASDRFSRPKEILVLDPKRSNQINIGIRGLPPVSSLKELIEKMDDTTISRAGVEKLQNLIPGEEELAQIKEAAKDADEDMPLGTAEQFLLMMSSIPGLECRLKLWAFKVDFKAMERDICEPLVALREGMKAVKSSDTFAALMAVVLAMGNTLNRSKVSGFQLDYLSKLSWVKDTSSKHSLLHHVTQVLMSEKADMADLSKEFSSLSTVARTDYELLGSNLAGMEEECKTSLGYLRLSFVYQPETRSLVSSFLTDAAERILSMQKVSALVAEEYTTFLTWLGLPAHLHRFLHIISFKQTGTNSQGLSSQCENNQGSNCHTQGLSCGSCGWTSCGNWSRGERDHHLTITVNNKIEHVQEFLFLTGGKGQREVGKGKSSGGKKKQGDEFAKVL